MTNDSLPPYRIHFGASYYPEHWPEEHWPEDIRLMKEANFTVVRMGEFSWSSLEPAPGEIRLDWLQRAVQLCADEGLVSVLGTPTAAPPAWLTHTTPDALAVNEDGRRKQHGNRCHYCPTSPDMISAARRIVTAMAERFGNCPYIIGWQIDNELGRVCYCERCHHLFQGFLQLRYGSLDNLNRHWSTAYWSQTYTAWEQIPIPVGSHNPGLMLEWKHFVTKINADFQRTQIDILRQYIPENVWISHNFMAWFDGFDHYQFSQDIDMASWDYYVGSGHHNYVAHGATHDLVRGFKRKNFWVMETQPGNVNWSPVNNVVNKWEARVMAWQAIAHGAEGFLYWQWRSALGGQEQYHGTLVDQAGKPRPFYEEAQQIGKEFAAISHLLEGLTAKRQVAMLNSYDSRWSIQWQRHHRDFNYVSHFNSFYHPLALSNILVDILGAETLTDARQLDGYKIVLAPALVIMDKPLFRILRNYVEKGGNLVLTARCGMKDRYNALHPTRQPGLLAKLAGVEVEEYYALDQPVPVKGAWFEGHGQIWAERLKLVGNPTTSTLAKYGSCNGWLDDRIAITASAYSRGMVYYVGTCLDDVAQQKLFERILASSLLLPVNTPPGVELRKLSNSDGEEILIVINHTKQRQCVTLPWPAYEHLSGVTVSQEIIQPPYGVAVLTKEQETSPYPQDSGSSPKALSED